MQTAITGITFTDLDADPANQDITVTFSVTNGTLNVLTNVLNGIIASDITGGAQNTTTITITAPNNPINTTIAGNGLRYTSNLNFNGTDTLHIVTSDNGHTGTPGALGDTDNLSITVLPVNDPVTGTAPASAVVDEDQSVAIPGLSIADVDTVIHPNGVYEVTLSATNGVVTLTTLTGLTFTAGDGTADATMTFHGILAEHQYGDRDGQLCAGLEFQRRGDGHALCDRHVQLNRRDRLRRGDQRYRYRERHRQRGERSDQHERARNGDPCRR